MPFLNWTRCIQVEVETISLAGLQLARDCCKPECLYIDVDATNSIEERRCAISLYFLSPFLGRGQVRIYLSISRSLPPPQKRDRPLSLSLRLSLYLSYLSLPWGRELER